MPVTFERPWQLEKGPFAVRYSRIAAALLGPMPGRSSSCAAVAVLMLIFPPLLADTVVGAGVSAGAEGAVAAVVEPPVSAGVAGAAAVPPSPTETRPWR